MSGLSGRTPEQIQEKIVASLVGNQLVGEHMRCDLVRGNVDKNPVVAAYEIQNGGVVVTYQGGRALTTASTPQTTGGRTQRRWSHQFRARVTYSNRVAAGQDLASDVAVFARQIVDFIEAGLEPQSGEQYDIPTDGIQLSTPIQHAKDPGYNVQDVMVTVRAFWPRP